MKNNYMRRVKVLHNPGAGNADHDKHELVSLITSGGFDCVYTSVKEKQWKIREPGIDILVIAGGDGTVRKVAKKLMKQKLLDGIWPVGLLPLGTANNVATTLELEDNSAQLIQSWHGDKRKKFDVGRLCGINETDFFLESFGYGLFPYLIQEMTKRKTPANETPEESMLATLQKLYELIIAYKPRKCRLLADGADHSGKYILAEVMNTRAIGPNIFLSPKSDPGDGFFEIVLVPESDKDKFAAYIKDKIEGREVDYNFHSIPAKQATIRWEGTHVHVDDEIVEIKKGAEIEIEIKPGLLEFLIP
jgi:diacylglycerol kinase (ATP)